MFDKLMNLLPIVSCQEATRLASLAMERRLTLKETFHLKLHLMVCSLCQTFQKQIQDLSKILHNYHPQHEKCLDPQTKKHLKTKIQQNIG